MRHRAARGAGGYPATAARTRSTSCVQARPAGAPSGSTGTSCRAITYIRTSSSSSATSRASRLGAPQFPAGEIKTDPFFGKQDIYRNGGHRHHPLHGRGQAGSGDRVPGLRREWASAIRPSTRHVSNLVLAMYRQARMPRSTPQAQAASNARECHEAGSAARLHRAELDPPLTEHGR